jgi:hypothetical protein
MKCLFIEGTMRHKSKVRLAVLLAVVFTIVFSFGVPATDPVFSVDTRAVLGVVGTSYIDIEYGVDGFDCDYVDVDLTQAIADIELGRPVTLPFYQTNFTLSLEPVDIYAPGAIWVAETDSGLTLQPAASHSYCGSVVGVGNSSARLTMTPDFFKGYVRLGETMYRVENAPNYPVRDDKRFRTSMMPAVPSASETAIGLLEDDSPCPVDSSLPILPTSHEESPRLTTASDPASQSTSEVERIVGQGDHNFYHAYGGNSYAEIESQINEVPSYWNFQGDVKISFQIVAILIHAGENDPLYSSNPWTLFNQFESHMELSHGYLQYHVAHLYTGKNLDGSVLGLDGTTYSLSQQVSEGFWSCYWASDYERAIVASQEIGHGYGGDHDLAYTYWTPGGQRHSNMWPEMRGGLCSILYGDLMLPDFSDANAEIIHNTAHSKQET